MTAIEFNNYVVMMQQKLRAFAYSLTLDRDDAQDLVQDTVLKAFTYREKFVDQSNLGAWLFTIMKNTFINNYRRRKKGRTIIDGTKELYYINIPEVRGNISPESTLAAKDLNKGIDQLEDEFKVPFKKHMSGFKYKEIADELKLPIGTVKSRIFLARQQLMEKFKDYHFA